MPSLELPHIKYKQSFLEAYQEFIQDGMWKDFDYSFLLHNFDKYVQELSDHREGKSLESGWVPHTQFWIIEDEKFVGLIDLRHRINDPLEKFGGHIGYEIRPSERKKGLASWALEKVIPYAKLKMLNEVLITCDDNNIASIKIIEKSGGVLKDKIQNMGMEQLTRRYWIQLI